MFSGFSFSVLLFSHLNDSEKTNIQNTSWLLFTLLFICVRCLWACLCVVREWPCMLIFCDVCCYVHSASWPASFQHLSLLYNTITTRELGLQKRTTIPGFTRDLENWTLVLTLVWQIPFPLSCPSPEYIISKHGNSCHLLHNHENQQESWSNLWI